MSFQVSVQDDAAIREAARGLGFLDMKAAAADQVACSAMVRDWVHRGYHADMNWFARNLEKRLDPRRIMEDAKTVLVFAASYHPSACRLFGMKLARYACGDDYHWVLRDKLLRLCDLIQKRYPAGQFRPYVDTGPVLERYWAQESGLGWIGKNGCLIVPRIGSYVFLACVLTNLIFPYTSKSSAHCGTCQACMDACPTQAIVSPGVVDARRCISYLTIEHRHPLPADTVLDGWVFGCDACQEVCPWNTKFAVKSACPAFEPRPEYDDLKAEDVIDVDPARFSRLFSKSPIKRAKRLGLERNVRHIRAQAAPD